MHRGKLGHPPSSDQRRCSLKDSKFDASPDRSDWGVAAWSMGGTCAVNLAVMHPEMFHAFVDVAGDLYPNAGSDSDAPMSRKWQSDNAVSPCHIGILSGRGTSPTVFL